MRGIDAVSPPTMIAALRGEDPASLLGNALKLALLVWVQVSRACRYENRRADSAPSLLHHGMVRGREICPLLTPLITRGKQ